jgi:hypothetical protein
VLPDDRREIIAYVLAVFRRRAKLTRWRPNYTKIISSGAMLWPVIDAASFDARQTAKFATSWGVTGRRRTPFMALAFKSPKPCR